MNRTSWIILAIAVAIIVILVVKISEDEKRRVEGGLLKSTDEYDIITFKLPNSSDPKVFGPQYWKAFHKLAAMVPCSTCQEKAVLLMRFMHDIVNKETEKGFYDKENFDFWVNYLNQNKAS